MMRTHLFVLFLLSSFTATAAEQIRVLGLFTGKAILLVDDKRYMLAVGEPARDGLKLLAADSNTALLEFNGRRHKLQLGNHISSYYPEAKTKVVDIYPDRNGMYLSSGTINGKSVSFLVDTGATTIALSGMQARRLGIDYRRQGIVGFVETASATVPAYHVKLNKVNLGAIRLYDVEATVLEGDKPGQVLLGQSFLNHLQMRRDGALLRLEQGY
jgi:aspartyl protease family protein